VPSLREVINLRQRFGTSMVDCRAAAAAYPGDFPAQCGCVYRRVAGRLPEDAIGVTGEPWRREFAALAPAEQVRMLGIARQRGD
jgi:hypothetical protein